MENEKGISSIKLIIAVVAIIIIISLAVNAGITFIEHKELEDLKTNMLLIQAKAKTYSEEVSVQTVNLDETKEEDSEKIKGVESAQLVGIKLSECSKEIQGKAQRAGVTELDQYYCLNKEDLEQMSINIELDEGEYYLVKYDLDDTEIVYTKGVKHENKTYYTLSELLIEVKD